MVENTRPPGPPAGHLFPALLAPVCTHVRGVPPACLGSAGGRASSPWTQRLGAPTRASLGSRPRRTSSPVLRVGSGQARVVQQLVLAQQRLKGHSPGAVERGFGQGFPAAATWEAVGRSVWSRLTLAPSKFTGFQGPHVRNQNRLRYQDNTSLIP